MRSPADLHASASFDEGQELSDRLQSEDAPCIPDSANGSSALKKSYKSLRGHTSDLTGLNIDFSELAGQVVRTGLDGDDRWGEESTVPEDVYGLITVTITKEITELLMRLRIGAPVKLSVIRLSLAFAMMVMNLGLQLGICAYTRAYICNASVRLVQYNFRHFRSHVFDASGSPDLAKWQAYELKEEICGMAISKSLFCYTILFLWTCTMLCELRTAQRILSTVYHLPSCTLASEMLAFQDHIAFEGRCCIVGLTRWARSLLYLLVVLPKFVISCFLLHIGSRWLISGSFSDMILNSLALGFVIEIDDLLFATMVPITQQTQVINTKFFFEEKKVAHLREVDERHLKAYKRTGFYMGFALVYLLVYMRYVQSVLPPDLAEVRQLCSEYLSEHTEPICNQTGYLGDYGGCYPYGSGDVIGESL